MGVLVSGCTKNAMEWRPRPQCSGTTTRCLSAGNWLFVQFANISPVFTKMAPGRWPTLPHRSPYGVCISKPPSQSYERKKVQFQFQVWLKIIDWIKKKIYIYIRPVPIKWKSHNRNARHNEPILALVHQEEDSKEDEELTRCQVPACASASRAGNQGIALGPRPEPTRHRSHTLALIFTL